MLTLKQIEANRRNAQKSTGPRTPEGKAISRRNAMKTGIDTQEISILGEDKADLETLTAEYCQRFEPATPEERCLVDIVIRSEWQLRRLSAVEAELWEHQIEPLPQEGYLRGHAFSLSDSLFARLQRRIDAAERSFYRALHELERLQSRPVHADPDPLPAPQPIASSPAYPPIGFVPQEGTCGESRVQSLETHPKMEGANPRFPPPLLRANQKDSAASPNPCEALTKLCVSAARR